MSTDLPIEGAVPAMRTAMDSGSMVLTAAPGAGKSSIVPIVAAEQASDLVVVLEPRRLAARATAQRLSELLVDCGGVGDLVGLTIRGERRRSPRTRIEVVTEAVLTNRLQRDPELSGVSTLVFDEFHERNLHSDLALGMALESRATIREDLRLIVMSATLDPTPIARLLGEAGPGAAAAGPAPVIEVPGRSFGVEIIHGHRPDAARWTAAVADTTQQALRDVAGGVLVFVPGRREINDVEQELRRRHVGVEVLVLHGGSPVSVQQRILADVGERRVIVATSIAETSVTIPGIEAVVDGGLLRRALYDPTSGLGRLETVHATRFAATQRAGRAGRLAPGRCYRLWSQEDHRHLDDAVPPEITDGDPLPVAFELARWGDPQALALPLLDHPGAERLAAGRAQLEQLGLVESGGVLTADGTAARSLGVHPRLAALLLEARRSGATELGLSVAALLDADRHATSSDLCMEVERTRRELRTPRERLRRRLGAVPAPTSASTADDSADLGRLLAAAWPDRVAMRRNGQPGRFLLATGREVYLSDRDPLATSEFLVVAEADGEARRARVRRAVALDRATLLGANPEVVRWTERVEWDDRDDSLRAERQQRWGSLVLHRELLASPQSDAVVAALRQGLRRRGLGLLNWDKHARALRERLAWLHEVEPHRWPAVADEDLLADLDRWLDLSTCRKPADLGHLDVGASLISLLGWEERRALDEVAPTRFPLPGGGEGSITYASGQPVLAVRVQQLFGLDTHPRIGPQNHALTIELLSPANRPAQRTTDLPGFWRGSYVDVRADLRGRYPKHPWPDEPWNARPVTPRRGR